MLIRLTYIEPSGAIRKGRDSLPPKTRMLHCAFNKIPFYFGQYSSKVRPNLGNFRQQVLAVYSHK